MIENIVEMPRRCPFFPKSEVKVPKIPFMEADLPYIEMRANFNFIFLIKYIWNLFKGS